MDHVSGKGSNKDDNKKEHVHQGREICLHTFSDLSRISPAIFVYLLKECYISGTHKATSKFRVLQQQVLQALYNEPKPGPAVFIVQCLYILPLLGSPYTEGFSHLLISSFHRLQTREKLSDSPEAKHLVTQLFVNILNCVVAHEERILIKLLEVFSIELEDIGKLIYVYKEDDDDNLYLDAAKAYLGHYICCFIENQSYMTAITLLEHFYLYKSIESSESFLSKMVQDNQFKAAEKLATLMGKSMICLLIQKYVDMNMLKNAYDLMTKNDLTKEFPESHRFYGQSSLAKLAERGVCETLESRQSFLDKMIEDNQFQAAEKWAGLMGKDMICLLINKYVAMNLLKKAYLMMKANDLQEEFPDVHHLYKRSCLKKFAEKGCWDVAEDKTNKDKDLLEYLVCLAMEAGYMEKVDELCERYSLSGFNKVKDPEACHLTSNYLDIKEFSVEGVSWIDEVTGLLNSTAYIEGCKFIGVDCEWKPNYVKGSKPNKVSIMQIASEERVFIFDLLKLYDDEPKTLNICFKRILHSPKILKLGYNLQCDLRQLSQSYGDLDCFRYYEMLLDIQKLFKESKGGLSGLAKKLLGAGLNKTRRNSNWEQRPLSQNQIDYAALDAVVLVHMFHHIHRQQRTTGFEDGKSKIEWKSHIVSLRPQNF